MSSLTHGAAYHRPKNGHFIPILLQHVAWRPQPMVSPVESKEHVGRKSHLVLQKYEEKEARKVGKQSFANMGQILMQMQILMREDLVEGVHHEQNIKI